MLIEIDRGSQAARQRAGFIHEFFSLISLASSDISKAYFGFLRKAAPCESEGIGEDVGGAFRVFIIPILK